VERRELVDLPDAPSIVATGPLTSAAFHTTLSALLGEKALAFFDAVAPIVTADSIDFDRVFRGSRYDKGGSDHYLNAAMNKDRYQEFVGELLAAQMVPFKDFETDDIKYFEGCLPIEVMAERGVDTLRYGPMKPVGLVDPSTGNRPWAVVQLRQDDLAAEHWNLVGFQTKLTQPEQKRIFRTIPGLEEARFVRFGMIHRNTFLNSPAHLDPLLRLNCRPDLRVAGQLTGVEGYVESAATGLMAAKTLAAERGGTDPVAPPADTAFGGLVHHLTGSRSHDFQPANINWGLIAQPQEVRGIRNRRERRERHAAIAVERITAWASSLS